MSKIQQLYPDLNCFTQTATEQTASVENPFYPIWEEPKQQEKDVDARIHEHTQALLEEFAGISEVILSPKVPTTSTSSNWSLLVAGIGSAVNRRPTYVDNSTNIQVSYTRNERKSAEQVKQENENNKTIAYVVIGLIGAVTAIVFAYLAGRDSSVLADKSEELDALRTHIQKWNDNKEVYSLSNETYQSYINPIDKMASSAEKIFSKRKANAIWSVATKVTVAASGAILLVGALFTSPGVIIGGALLGAATITVIAFRAGFDRTERDEKRYATAIREQLSKLFPPITNPSINPEFVQQ